MAEKKEGEETVCKCGTHTICRVKPASDKYPEKLQWQNPDGSAHYSYDFQTKTTSCNIPGITSKSDKRITDIPEPTPEELLATARELNKQDKNKMSEETINRFYNEAAHEAIIYLIRKASIENIQNKAGVKHPSRVAFTHEVMESLRG